MADQVDDAVLHHRIGKDGVDRLGKTFAVLGLDPSENSEPGENVTRKHIEARD
jgi:hypothetical protein